MAYIGRGINNISNAIILDVITFTNSVGPYNITEASVAFTPISAQALVISVDGVIQSPTSYTISNATITFTGSMSSSQTMDFMVHNGVGLTVAPAAGSVTTNKIADHAVTYVKIQETATDNRVIGAATAGTVGEVQVSNAMLVNDDITINGTAVDLGGSITVQAALNFPTVTGMTENAGGTTTVVPNTSTACTITGTNFVTGATINLISTTGAILNPETVSFTNTTTLAVSINIPEGSYFVRVENSNGLSGRSSSTAITASNTPTWVTNSGSLGTFAGGTTGTITTIVATSTDASPALNMTATSTLTGSSTNQANCQLTVNTVGTTTTGTIASSGGLGINESAATDYIFTVTATDGTPQSTSRSFTISTSYTIGNSGQFN
jgi:hypothetical protein